MELLVLVLKIVAGALTLLGLISLGVAMLIYTWIERNPPEDWS